MPDVVDATWRVIFRLILAMLPLFLISCLPLYHGINDVREDAGLEPLPRSSALSINAEIRAEWMADHGKLRHLPGLAPGQAEIIGRGSNMDAIITGFVASPEHHAIIVGDYNVMGTGNAWRGDILYVSAIFE